MQHYRFSTDMAWLRLGRGVHCTPDLAILVGGIVEEAAQAGIRAGSIGGPVEIPEALRAAALQRAMTFAAKGTASRTQSRPPASVPRVVPAKAGYCSKCPSPQACPDLVGWQHKPLS
jgi:hypothetical protein